MFTVKVFVVAVTTLRGLVLQGTRSPPDRQIHRRADGTNHERCPRQRWAPKSRPAEPSISRIRARAVQCERDGAGCVDQRNLDAVGRREDAVSPVDAECCHDHHREHQSWPQRTTKPKRHEHTTDNLAKGSGRRKDAARTEADLLEEGTSAAQSVPAE